MSLNPADAGVNYKNAQAGNLLSLFREQIVREGLIKCRVGGDGLQAVRNFRSILVALATEGLSADLIRVSLASNLSRMPT